LRVAVVAVARVQDLPPTKAALIGAVAVVVALDTTLVAGVVVVVRAVRDQVVLVVAVAVPLLRGVPVVDEVLLVVVVALLAVQILALVVPAEAQVTTSLATHL
jgi:hypothetical protein